ncbi:MAG: primosomal protein N' [Lachnospiraceae bacterium]|nr:primosomal protein N' [Lachnospiraceae bacterium]
MEGKYANIIVDISHEKVDRPFQYKIPERLKGKIEPGTCVQVPFGVGNKPLKGYVIEVTDNAEYDTNKLKEINKIEEGVVGAEANAIKLAWWMKTTYGSTMIQSLKTVLPVKKEIRQLEKRTLKRLADREVILFEKNEAVRKKQVAKARVLSELLEAEELPYELVTGKLNISSSTIQSLERQGLVKVERQSFYRNPVKAVDTQEEKKMLSRKQQEITDAVLSDYDNKNTGTYLLHGITGSGKTEVYMEMIEGMMQRKKASIVLIPEIALTYQTLMRFYRRFGDRVSVMNSTLSNGEKFDQFERAKKGEIDVIIGPRSALFTPFKEIGLIIIDEEHENSYKSETMPKYHARETAVEIARMHGASVVLGSATPSLEAYYRAKQGEYKLFTLKERLTGGTLPAVYTVDLREELKQGNRSIFSVKLKELMEDRLAKKQQIMLFLNRRGYAGFVSCRACGLVLKCPHCDVSLSEHWGGKLVCHYCGYEQSAVTKCPDCGSKYILGFKAGTEQVEEQVRKVFPDAKVLRMDADTTKKKESYERILSAFANKEADILVGTQMIVKGHDFPNVTLVGILAADLSLSANDYRAGERTFQLLTQAAGRAGRGEQPGEVVIQTYQPEHYSIVHASEQNYEAFYEAEMCYRDLLSYPPAAHLMAVQIMAKDEKKGERLAEHLSKKMKEEYKTKALELRLSIIGPAKAGIGKINDIYRYVFYVKCKNYVYLTEIKDKLEEEIFTLQLKNEMVQFDFDPMNTF